MYVITSHTVGSLPMVPAVHLNYGQAAILTPSDFQFSRDGIYLQHDPESLGHAAVTEWLNHDVAKPKHYARRNRMFLRRRAVH